MILRIANLTDGNLSIEALRASFEVGESKDVTLNRKLDSILIDNNAELAQLIADGDITLEEIGEVLKGYDSGWTDIAAGATETFTHNLDVDPSRMLVDVMANDGALGVGTCHYKGNGGDIDDGANVLGYMVSEVSNTELKVIRGANDANVLSIRVRIQVQG